MPKISIFNFNKDNIFFSGNNFFLLGVFFLPTALPISGLFLIVSILKSFNKKNYLSLNDKWNYPFYISFGLILFSCINISLINKSKFLIQYDYSLVWLNLFNWIPFIILFCGFQSYLETHIQRINFSKFLVSGTIPVLFSFIFQKFFNWYGPHNTLYGLIIWFQKPIIGNNGASGLFSNPNYAGIWLALVLPFSIYLFQKSKKITSRIITFLICIMISYSIFLTFSRNALLGFLITIIILYGLKRVLSNLIMICIPILILNFFTPIKNLFLSINFTDLLIVEKFMDLNFFLTPRIGIWQSALSRIIERPFWGWGPSTFATLHIKNNTAFKIPIIIIPAKHSHNLPLELAHNFGIPLAIIVVITFILLLIFSWKRIYGENNYFIVHQVNKIWFTSSLIIFASHLTDITFYDGKINILIAILFAGLRCIINEKRIRSKDI